jgi:iron complex outermembrane receptor protein
MTVSRLATLPLAVLSAFAVAMPAQAADEVNGSEPIVVVGSRLKGRTKLNTAVPVDVLSQEEIQRAAGPAGDLGTALQVLLPSFNFPHQSNSGSADHVRAAQLRGTSPDQVLVLINGKRRHTTSIVNLEATAGRGTTPVDFNSIPLNAIARVEVLRDGAGAQYGSDAIGGVINIILDNASEGGEVEALYGANHTHFAPTNQTITDGQTTELHAKAGTTLGAGGFLRGGAEYTQRNATNRAGAGTLPDFSYDSTPANLAFDNQRVMGAGDPDQHNANVWFNTSAAVDGGNQVYAFGTYNHRTSVGAAYFRYPDGSTNVTSIYPHGFLPESTGTNQDVSLFAGIKGTVAGDWRYDASLGLGINDFEYGLRHSLNSSLGSASPIRFKLGDFRNDQLTANLDFTRTLAVGGIDTALAVGAELRREGYRTSAGDVASYIAGPNIPPGEPGSQGDTGLTPADAVNVSRTVAGVYAEASADLTHQLFGDAAVRFDHYSDFGSAFTAKLSGRYAITPAVALRGAVSSNFRAPSLAQNAFSFSATDYVANGTVGPVLTIPVANPIARALGAQDLKAEKSRNISFGITAQPTASIQLSLDGYQIDVDDRITLSQSITGDALTAFLQSRLGNTNVGGVSFFTNAVDTRTRGVDLVASWTVPLAGGTLKLSDASSYAKTTLRHIRSDNAALTALGITGELIGLQEQNALTTAAPKRRDVISANWSDPAWSLMGRLTRHGSTTRVFDFGGGYVPTQTYGAVWQLDAEVAYRFNKQLSVAVGGTNLGDKYPDRSIPDIAYYGHLPYDFISPIGMNGAFYYGRLNYKF